MRLAVQDIALRAGSFRLGPLTLDVGDGEYLIVLGPTGAGKSVFLAVSAASFLKYPRTQVVFFDKDRSSRFACLRCGGAFVEISREATGAKLHPCLL